MQIEENKKILMKVLGNNIRELRGEKSQFLLAGENDISCSIISTVERGMKDPQVTTLFKIAEALNIKASKLVSNVEKQLPENFTFIDC